MNEIKTNIQYKCIQYKCIQKKQLFVQELLFSIHIRDGELQCRSDTHPDQIRDLHIRNPMSIRIDCYHRPNKRS